MKVQFRIFLAALVICLFLPMLCMPASAAEVASGTCGDSITWLLDDAGTLTVSGTGDMPDYVFDSNVQGTTAPWYSHSATITSVVVGEGITYIGEYSFMNLHNVSAVTLPSTLTEIGGHAFQHLQQLSSIVLPEGLESTGEYAFGGSTFSELHIPASMKSLGCLSVSAPKVYIDTLEHWLNLEFMPDKNGAVGVSGANPLSSDTGALYIGGELATDIVIPEGTTEIDPYRFYQLTTMTSITIPGSVTTIGEGAFWGCDGLTEITIPDTVTTLGGRTLMECENLITVKLPAGLTQIPESTFRGCTNLENFTMPENVISIGRSAFEGCGNLTHFSETNSLEKVNYIGGYAFVNCKKLQFGALKLSSNLYYLGDDWGGYAFARCEGITSVTIPGSLSNVAWTAFENCINLEHVTIQEGVVTIGSGAFYNCPKLTSVVLPKTVATIKGSAFDQCPNLSAIYILNENCQIADPNPNYNTGATVYPIGIPGVTTVYGKAGSTAETYAATHGFAFEELPQICEYGYHTYVASVVKEMTCAEDGLRTYTCTECSNSYEEAVPAIGHNIVENVCSNCNISFIAHGTHGDCQWTLDTEGTLTLYTLTDNGYVLGAPWAEYAEYVKKFVLGQNITQHYMSPPSDEDVERGDPVYYPNLTTIEFGKMASLWYDSVNAPNLRTYIVHEDHYSYYVLEGALALNNGPEGEVLMWNCPPALASGTYRIPDSFDQVDMNAFRYASNLEKLYIPCDLIYAGNLTRCTALTDVYILTTENFYPWSWPDEIFVEDLFGNQEKVTLHGYKGTFVEEFAATCGYKFVELTQCDIDGHKLSAVDKVAANCVATGTEAHYKCSVCGELFADNAGDRAVTEESLVLPIDSAVHTGKTEVKDAKDATCAALGYSGDTYCVSCGVKLTDGIATGKVAHKLNSVDKVAATCVATGVDAHYRCSVCNVLCTDDAGVNVVTEDALVLAIDTNVHKLTQVAGIAATCTTGGNVEYWHCADCGKNFAEENGATELAATETAALGHAWDEGKTQNGMTTYNCLHCTETKVLILPPSGMSVGLSGNAGALEDGVLTGEEKQRVEQGEDTKIYLEVSDISNSVSATDKELVAQKLGKNTVGLYMDINLFKQLGDDRPIQVTETNGKVKIRINIPPHLLNTDTMVSRSYQIIRIHNGVAEVIEGTFNKNNNVFVFETDCFSTYVLVYSDTKLTTPPTGDEMNLVLWSLALTVSAAAVVALISNKRKFFA